MGTHSSILACRIRQTEEPGGLQYMGLQSWTQLKQLNMCILGSPGGFHGKEPASQCRICKRCGFDPWVRKIPWKRTRQLTPVFLPGETHGLAIVGYSPYGCKELDMTKMT